MSLKERGTVISQETDMRVRVLGVVLACLFAVADGTTEARGQVVLFNTFGAGDTFSTTAPLVVGRPSGTTNVFAAKFTTVSNGTIIGAQVALGPTTPSGQQVTLTASIFGHNAATGLPTSSNDTMVSQTITLGSPQTVTFQSTRFNETFSGTTGWLVIAIQEPVTSGRTVSWNKSPSATGPVAVNGNGAGFTLQGANAAMPAFKILGEALNGACCNPDTGQCVLTGHFACIQFTGFHYTAGIGCTPNPCAAVCRADFDRNGDLAVADIFSYLDEWFAGCP